MCCFFKHAACSFPLCPELPLISLGCVRYRRLLTFQTHLQEMSAAVLWSGLKCLTGALQGKGEGCCWSLVNLSSIQTGKCSLVLRKCIGQGIGQGEGWICVPLGLGMSVNGCCKCHASVLAGDLSAWCFALMSMILVAECFVKKAGFRHLLHREAARICVGTMLPLATSMHLLGEENKQKCVLGTHMSCSNLVLK